MCVSKPADFFGQQRASETPPQHNAERGGGGINLESSSSNAIRETIPLSMQRQGRFCLLCVLGRRERRMEESTGRGRKDWATPVKFDRDIRLVPGVTGRPKAAVMSLRAAAGAR
jgi:hypothetical protein